MTLMKYENERIGDYWKHAVECVDINANTEYYDYDGCTLLEILDCLVDTQKKGWRDSSLGEGLS